MAKVFMNVRGQLYSGDVAKSIQDSYIVQPSQELVDMLSEEPRALEELQEEITMEKNTKGLGKAIRDFRLTGIKNRRM